MDELLPVYTEEDTREFIRLGLNNLYHEICHRYVFENGGDGFRQSYRQVFFILQNLHFLETGDFCATHRELLEQTRGTDHEVLQMAAGYRRGANEENDMSFERLFCWLQETIRRVG